LPRSSQGDPIAAAKGAINIYGIEAQPFITQVVSMVLYTDAPASAQPVPGDMEYDPARPIGVPQDPITVNGQVPTSTGSRPSPDFLGEFLAFQLINPFNESIQLSKFNVDPNAPPQAMTDN